MTRSVNPNSLLITHTEAARILGVCPTTVVQMIAGGRLQGVRISDRNIRATRASVMALVAPPSAPPTPSVPAPAPVSVSLDDQEVLPLTTSRTLVHICGHPCRRGAHISVSDQLASSVPCDDCFRESYAQTWEKARAECARLGFRALTGTPEEIANGERIRYANYIMRPASVLASRFVTSARFWCDRGAN